MGRFGLRDGHARLDPEQDHERIVRALATLEFPWDTRQALSFALFRTYAVPSIGRLLDATGEFTRRTQKRHDDTALILEAVVEHGMGSDEGRDAVRRMNRMHGAYAISDDDMRYVLSTFVVTPVRWIERYGWRRLTDAEVRASTAFYRSLGRRMAIGDIPETYDEFAVLLDEYEEAHFAFDPASRRVADATLDLMTTFRQYRHLPPTVTRQLAYALMDDHLLDALHYPRPTPALRRAAQSLVRLRGRAIRLAPPRRRPVFAREHPDIRSYPHGYRVADLGTFPARVDTPS